MPAILNTPPVLTNQICLVENISDYNIGTVSGYESTFINKELYNYSLCQNFSVYYQTNFEKDNIEELTYLNAVEEILPSYYTKNKEQLNHLYALESKKYSNYIDGIQGDAYKIFESLSKNLSELEFEAVNLELTSEQSIKFILLFAGKKMLMVSKNISVSELNEDEIIFSFFINRKLITSNVAKIEDFTRSFKGYLYL